MQGPGMSSLTPPGAHPYIGHCSKCGELLELDTATALCEKCSPKTSKPKKETP